jgi:hypothetical protein
MPAYTFRLLNDSDGVTDDLGLRLPSAKAAHDYACDVALELMDHREEATRSWRLDVYENGAKKLCEILFATIDQTLDHLKPDNRKLVETTAMRRRSLQETYRCGTDHVPRISSTGGPFAREALPRDGSWRKDDPRLEVRSALETARK